MKRISSLVCMVLMVALLAGCVATKKAVANKDFLKETKEEKDERMKWWREARFGMFIHWGVYAVPAGTHNGKRVGGIGEWIMHKGKIPVPEYEKYAKQFNPVKYDAEEWVKMAKDAGMKYIVITSKHHDGFCLWDSKVTDYDIVDFTPYKKDLLKPLAKACKKHGVKLCFYHSIMDWHHPDAKGANFPKYSEEYMIPQLRELLSGEYGDIGVIWFDGEWIGEWTSPMGKALYQTLREVKPDLIINNRVDKGRKGYQGMNKDGDFAGDFGTPEQQIPATGMPGLDWESCMTMNDTWGFKSYDHKWKSKQNLIRKLVDIASKGGNFLLNIGPTAEGLIPEPSVERLAAVGDWMEVNSESIYGTTASPYAMPKWGRYTAKEGKIYAHVFDWPKDGKLSVPTGDLKIKKVYLMADKEKEIETEKEGSDLVIKLPADAPDKIASVVVIEHK